MASFINSAAKSAAAVAAPAASWVSKNPGKATVYGIGAAAMAAPGVVVAPVLAAVGFGSAGPIAGSAAAAVQSSVGSMVAPSVFSTLQSAAMGGAGAAVVNGVVQVGGAGLAAVTGAASYLFSGNGSRRQGEEGGEEEGGQTEGGKEGRSGEEKEQDEGGRRET